MSRPTPVAEPASQKSAESRYSEPESKKSAASAVEDRRSASKKEQQEKELAALAEYRKQYFMDKQAAAMKNKIVVDDQLGRPTNEPTSPPPPANVPVSRDNSKKESNNNHKDRKNDERDDHDPYKLVKPPSLEKLSEKLKVKKEKDVDSLSASDADKRHEEFLKWKAEQQKLAKQKKKEMDVEVLESPIKRKPDENDESSADSPSHPSSSSISSPAPSSASSSPSKSSSSPSKPNPVSSPPTADSEEFSQGLPTEDRSEIVRNKTIEEEAQDINDYEDMMDNMREILSQSANDQEVPEEIEEQEEINGEEEAPSSGNSFSKFTLLGETLRLPNVSDRDSLMYRIESLRLFLEDKLGMDVFIKVYHLLNNTDTSPETSVDNEIALLLKEPQMPLLSLIHQLIFCEDRMYDM